MFFVESQFETHSPFLDNCRGNISTVGAMYGHAYIISLGPTLVTDASDMLLIGSDSYKHVSDNVNCFVQLLASTDL